MSGAVTATAIGAGIAAGGSLAGGAIAAHSAGKAADTQAAAATQAAQYQKQATDQALQYQQQQNQQTQANLSPYMQYGGNGLSNLSYLLGIGPQQSNVAQGSNTPYQPGPGGVQQAQIGNTSTPAFVPNNPNGVGPIDAQAQLQATSPGSNSFNPSGAPSPVGNTGAAQQVSAGQIIPQAGAPSLPAGVNPSLGAFGSLNTPYQSFSAPTDITMQNDPGYQARLKLGTDVLQHSAAARGNVLTGGTVKALDTYAQDYASNEYGNVYNRALSGYQTNAGNYYTGQNNTYSRLMGLVNSGQNAATTASTLGQSGANSVSNTLIGGANAVNQQNNNAAAATASGYVGGANALGGALSGAGNNIGNLIALQQLNGSGYGGSSSPYQTLYNAQNPDRNNLAVTNPNLSAYTVG